MIQPPDWVHPTGPRRLYVLGRHEGVTAYLVDAAAFKAVEGLPAQSLVGSIPIHSRYRLSAQQARDNLAYVNSDVASLVITFDLEEWRAAPKDSHLNTEAVDQVMGILAGSLAESGLAHARSQRSGRDPA